MSKFNVFKINIKKKKKLLQHSLSFIKQSLLFERTNIILDFEIKISSAHLKFVKLLLFLRKEFLACR